MQAMLTLENWMEMGWNLDEIWVTNAWTDENWMKFDWEVLKQMYEIALIPGLRLDVMSITNI